jgi:hypothetical protein
MKNSIINIFLALNIVFLLCGCEQNDFTRIDIEENMFDFGEIKSKDTIYHTFNIKNLTKTPFVIEKVLAGCECTSVVNFSDTTYFNQNAKIKIRFVPEKEDEGILNKVVLVQCNAQKGVVRLNIVGIVQ